MSVSLSKPSIHILTCPPTQLQTDKPVLVLEAALEVYGGKIHITKNAWINWK